MGHLGRTCRAFLGTVAGIAVGIGSSFVVKHGVLAPVLGSLTAVAIADLDAVVEVALVGLVTGAGTGAFLAIGGDPLAGESLAPRWPWSVIVSMLSTVVIGGLVGGMYAFLMRKLKTLYDEGRGPFF